MPDPATATLAAAGISAAGGFISNALAGSESKRARQWSERMRGSQWQATVADMEAAGINPAVAYSRGTNAVPSGPTASYDNPLDGSVTSALAARAQNKQLELLDAQIWKATEDAKISQAEAQMRWVDRSFKQAEAGFYFNGDGTMRPELVRLLEQQYSAKLATSGQELTRLESMKLSIPEQQAIARVWESIGGPGKGGQLGLSLLMPLLTTLLRGQR